MTGNPVRDIHDEVAESANPAQASVRPPGTSARQLAAMTRDVLDKLALTPKLNVVEVGCGVGVLGVPLAERSARYVGLDFAPRAVAVANQALAAAGLASRAHAQCLDVLSADGAELEALGRFDRLLMYAVFHYARDASEARRFLRRSIDLLVPGGLALIGNLPLDDLEVDWTPAGPTPAGLIGRAASLAEWLLRPGRGAVPLTRGWKLRHVVQSRLNARAAGAQFTAAQLPPDHTLPLTTAAVEAWLGELGAEVEHAWALPRPGVPLAARRADLILRRR